MGGGGDYAFLYLYKRSLSGEQPRARGASCLIFPTHLISYQSFFRKHSFLDNWYHAWLASTELLQMHGYMSKGGARAQNLGHHFWRGVGALGQ